MKKCFNFMTFIVMSVIALSFTSCKEDEPAQLELRSENEILKFEIPAVGLEGIINAESATIELLVPSDIDESLLKDLTPVIEYSTGAEISPAPTVAQDFSKDVKYTVTAQNGDEKEWTVTLKHSDYVLGIGKTTQIWLNTDATSPNVEPALAVLDGYVVLSRSGVVLDANGNTLSDKKLNMEGIAVTPESTDAQNIPFVLTNDDAGNLIGATLGAWGAYNPEGSVNEFFRVYKWSSIDADPEEVLCSNEAGSAKLGRRLNVVGDINNNAYVTSYRDGTEFFVWKIENGVVTGRPNWADVPEKINMGHTGTNTMYQQLIPVSTSNIFPYYYGGRHTGATASTVRYVPFLGGEEIFIPGPFTNDPEEPFKSVGWGNYVLDMYKFKFNDRDYLAVMSLMFPSGAESPKYYITIIDLKDEANEKFTFACDPIMVTFDSNTPNGNLTAGITAGPEVTDGELRTKKLYAVYTGLGVACFELSNSVK